MKSLLLSILAIFAFVSITGCVNGNNGTTDYSDTLAADTMPVEANDDVKTNEGSQIRVPMTFDPKTPLTDKLKNANLQELIIQKYNSFKKKSNRRKHKPVLHNRINSDGVIDLTVGGPLSYEESWEIVERGGEHTLADYFFDAAHIDRWDNAYSGLVHRDPEFKIVSETSNLAKVYFIDDFSGFVQYNKSFCDKIINRLEQNSKSVHQQEVEERQKMYE